MSLNQWSSTPSNNDLTGYGKTGMQPSQVKNAFWNLMADIKQALFGLPTATGTGNAQVVTQTRPITAYFKGHYFFFIPVATNTGATTVNVDTLGTRNIFANGAALVGGELQPTVPAALYDDGTQYNLLNPCRTDGAIAISGTSTLTGTAGGVTAYYDGLRIRGKMASTTTGTPTLNINSLGAKNVYYKDGTTQSQVGSNIQNVIYDWIYDSSLNSSAGGWLCVNPSRGTGSFTSTIVGGPSNPTINYTVMPDGDDCYFRFPGFTGTGTGTTFTMTVPANLIPANTQTIGPIYAEDATAAVVCFLSAVTSSPWSFNQTGNVSISVGWTAGGTRGINRSGQCVRYKLVS